MAERRVGWHLNCKNHTWWKPERPRIQKLTNENESLECYFDAMYNICNQCNALNFSMTVTKELFLFLFL